MAETTPPEYRNKMQVIQRNNKGFKFQYIVELSQERSDQQRRKREARSFKPIQRNLSKTDDANWRGAVRKIIGNME